MATNLRARFESCEHAAEAYFGIGCPISVYGHIPCHSCSHYGECNGATKEPQKLAWYLEWLQEECDGCQ